MLVSVVLGHSQATGAAGRPGGRWRGREARRPMARHYRAKTGGCGNGAGCQAAHRSGEPPRAKARRREPGGPAAKHRALPQRDCMAMGRGDGVAQRGTATGPHGDGAWRGNGRGDARCVSICHNTRGAATVLSPETFPSVAHNPECQSRNRRNLDNRVFCRNAVRLHRPA